MSTALNMIGITGTWPVMTEQVDFQTGSQDKAGQGSLERRGQISLSLFAASS
jgi:hypothetical protein